MLCILERLLEPRLALRRLTSEDVSPCELIATTHVVYWHIVWWNLFCSAVEHFDSLLFLAFCYKIYSQLAEEPAVGVAHAHHCLVEIDALLADTTELEASHDVLIYSFGVEVLHSLNRFSSETCLERRDAVGETLLHEVVAKAHVVVAADGGGNIDRTCPVALHQHLQNHEV